MSVHTPVLLQESIELLEIKPGELFVDATLGAGGHTQEILAAGGYVIGIDQDASILEQTKKQLNHPNLQTVQANFAEITTILQRLEIEQIDGILFDLGVSSLQLDTGQRGFSFNKDARLDMRMDTSATVTAEALVNSLSEQELFVLLTKYSQERFARRIAFAIVTTRSHTAITSTTQLAQIVADCYPNRPARIHPATKTFQALRMEVNQELAAIETAIPAAIEALKPGGRMCVIAFHETEDRLVKLLMKQAEVNNTLERSPKKVILPSKTEVRNNPRSRSAKLRRGIKAHAKTNTNNNINSSKNPDR